MFTLSLTCISTKCNIANITFNKSLWNTEISISQRTYYNQYWNNYRCCEVEDPKRFRLVSLVKISVKYAEKIFLLSKYPVIISIFVETCIFYLLYFNKIISVSNFILRKGYIKFTTIKNKNKKFPVLL